MNIIFITPTGIGLSIGGHAGDATPAARLLSKVCDKIILHPNVVNASDINEMPENALYVMGSTIDDLLMGYVGIREVYSNRIAVVVNRPVTNDIINMVSSARAVLGVDAFIVELGTELKMKAGFNPDGSATGIIEGAIEVASYLGTINKSFDAVAILTSIDLDKSIATKYITNGGVNPWGGVEAKLTRFLTDILKVPCAHAPFGHTLENFDAVVDPRVAAEMVSVTYAFCVLKGLHKAPEITENIGITASDIDVLISPIDCHGIPHVKCLELGIPIITVAENIPTIKNQTKFPQIKAATYLEATGILLAMQEGISLESVGRPILPTEILYCK